MLLVVSLLHDLQDSPWLFDPLQGNISQDMSDPTKFFQDDNDPSKVSNSLVYLPFLFTLRNRLSFYNSVVFYMDRSRYLSCVQDLFAVGAIIAFIYFIFQAYSEISKLKWCKQNHLRRRRDYNWSSCFESDTLALIHWDSACWCSVLLPAMSGKIEVSLWLLFCLRKCPYLTLSVPIQGMICNLQPITRPSA